DVESPRLWQWTHSTSWERIPCPDLEELRTHLGVESWVINGVSWGSTLAMLRRSIVVRSQDSPGECCSDKSEDRARDHPDALRLRESQLGCAYELLVIAGQLAESAAKGRAGFRVQGRRGEVAVSGSDDAAEDRKSTRLKSNHVSISYSVFCLKKKRLHK